MEAPAKCRHLIHCFNGDFFRGHGTLCKFQFRGYLNSMEPARSFRPLIERLRQSGLRPTRQRLALARLLFDKGNRHISAEQLHEEAQSQAIRVSLATVYNSLNQFTAAGLLREVVVAPGRSYFDTNIGDHHHFYVEPSGELHDIPADQVSLQRLPPSPAGKEIARVDVVIRLRPASKSQN